MADIYDWSTTAADNDDADTTINWLEGQLPGTVNGSSRAGMKRVKELLNDISYAGTVGGTADAITLTSAIAALASNKIISFKATAANTGAATLAVNALTAKAIRKISGGTDVALAARDIQTGGRYSFVYDSAANAAAGAWILLNPSGQGPYTEGHLFGCTLSNGTDATNDIDIAAGSARDSTNTENIVLASVLTKQLDAAWAVGSAAGGLDTGAIANATYHVYLIKRVDTGVVDAIFSTSASAPTLPTGYTLYRRIGSILREAAAIVAFTQIGDTFIRSVPVRDYDSNNPGTSAVTVTLSSLPTGVKVKAHLYATTIETTPGGATFTLFTSLDQTDRTPSASIFSFYGVTEISGGTGEVNVFTNTSAQIRCRISRSEADTTVRIMTNGWVDTRGRI